MTEKLEKPQRLSTNQYMVYKDWYIEAHRYPKYILTADLAFAAFEGTNFIVNSNNKGLNTDLLLASMICLGLSGLFAGAAMFFCYRIFETGVRDYLAPVTWQLGLHPSKQIKKIRKRGFIAWILFAVAAFMLIWAVGILFAFTIDKLNAKGVDDCQTLYLQDRRISCEHRHGNGR